MAVGVTGLGRLPFWSCCLSVLLHPRLIFVWVMGNQSHPDLLGLTVHEWPWVDAMSSLLTIVSATAREEAASSA